MRERTILVCCVHVCNVAWGKPFTSKGRSVTVENNINLSPKSIFIKNFTLSSRMSLANFCQGCLHTSQYLCKETTFYYLYLCRINSILNVKNTYWICKSYLTIRKIRIWDTFENILFTITLLEIKNSGNRINIKQQRCNFSANYLLQPPNCNFKINTVSI